MPTLGAGEIQLLRKAIPNTLLSMRCTIQRATVGEPSDWGNETVTWANHLVNVPCWWDSNSGRARDINITGPDINALVDTQRVVFKANTDIEAGDRILEIIGPDNHAVAENLLIDEVVKSITLTAALVREIGQP
jgi:hypothetical protein